MHRKTPVLEFFQIQLQASNTGVFLWFCEIFKNTFFTEHLRVAGELWEIWNTTFLYNCFCAPQVFIEIFRNCLKRFESKKSLLHLKTHYSCFYFRILSFRNCKTWWEISTVFCFIEINILYIFNWNLSLVTHMHKLYFKN